MYAVYTLYSVVLGGVVTHLLPQERHVVVGLLRGGQVSQSREQRGPGGPGGLGAAVLLLLHVVLGPVEGEHAELREEALQDGPLAGNGPQLLRRFRH